MTKLLLNMIIRNESERIERCLASVKPFICGAVICDTGSTDDTMARCEAALDGVPYYIPTRPFVDFSTTRNEALFLARKFIEEGNADAEYILLLDADMVLCVEDPRCFEDLTAPAYQIEQRTLSDLRYSNTRLLRADVPATYQWPTHEALSVDNPVPLTGCWFLDHADGANRPEKFKRDIALLERYLLDHPDDPRSVYYLAQSYRDGGDLKRAAAEYARRAALGGWDEEVWSSKLHEGRCYLADGDAVKFVAAALAAYALRPTRAEPLLDLARHYRHQPAMQAPALLFADAAAAIKRPADILFVEAEAYSWGPRYERSIVGGYLGGDARARAAADCEALACAPTVPAWVRDSSRNNLAWYAEPLKAETHRIDWQAPDGWNAHNPGLALKNGYIDCIIRAGNYWLHEDGSFTPPPGDVVRTRNFICSLNFWGQPLLEPREIAMPEDWQPPLSPRVQGFEDARLFWWRGEMWASATMHELTAEGWCEIALTRIHQGIDGYSFTDWHILSPAGPKRNEKNWMPVVDQHGERLRFVYMVDPLRIIDDKARTVLEKPATGYDHLRGGSPLLDFDGGWLAATHEVANVGGMRKYLHRWVWWDRDFERRRVSRAFVVHGSGEYEYIGGLVEAPNDQSTLVFCFGKWCREAWIGRIDADVVRGMLG